jgi:hypothetical protein
MGTQQTRDSPKSVRPDLPNREAMEAGAGFANYHPRGDLQTESQNTLMFPRHKPA